MLLETLYDIIILSPVSHERDRDRSPCPVYLIDNAFTYTYMYIYMYRAQKLRAPLQGWLRLVAPGGAGVLGPALGPSRPLFPLSAAVADHHPCSATPPAGEVHQDQFSWRLETETNWTIIGCSCLLYLRGNNS